MFVIRICSLEIYVVSSIHVMSTVDGMRILPYSKLADSTVPLDEFPFLLLQSLQPAGTKVCSSGSGACELTGLVESDEFDRSFDIFRTSHGLCGWILATSCAVVQRPSVEAEKTRIWTCTRTIQT